jgi:hypothetical protein
MGFVAHIPHYVAQFDYPSAAATMLGSVEVATGLQWDLDPLEAAGQARMTEIVEQIDDSEEVREVVRGLEQQYDAFTRPRTGNAETGDLPLADEPNLPTGEELGEEFERFLAGLDRPGDKPNDRPNDND